MTDQERLRDLTLSLIRVFNSARAAAEFLGTSERTLRRWIAGEANPIRALDTFTALAQHDDLQERRRRLRLYAHRAKHHLDLFTGEPAKPPRCLADLLHQAA